MQKNNKYAYLRKKRYLSNDDIGMLNEKASKKNRKTTPICDTHMDGA